MSLHTGLDQIRARHRAEVLHLDPADRLMDQGGIAHGLGPERVAAAGLGAKWTEKRPDPDNPAAAAWIFFGDGKGRFRKTEFVTGMGFHEARLADLDGDGTIDILSKPYNWDAPRVDVWLQRRSGAPKSAPQR